MSTSPDPIPSGVPLRWLCTRRVLHERCPQCGEGRLFAGFMRLAERCAHCGLIYRREQGAQTGSMYVSAAVTEIFAALLAVAMFLFTDWSAGTGLLIGIPLVLAFSYAFLPYSMSLWVGAEYLTDAGNGEWWVQPRP